MSALNGCLDWCPECIHGSILVCRYTLHLMAVESLWRLLKIEVRSAAAELSTNSL